jgi:hypothetical protein
MFVIKIGVLGRFRASHKVNAPNQEGAYQWLLRQYPEFEKWRSGGDLVEYELREIQPEAKKTDKIPPAALGLALITPKILKQTPVPRLRGPSRL